MSILTNTSPNVMVSESKKVYQQTSLICMIILCSSFAFIGIVEFFKNRPLNIQLDQDAIQFFKYVFYGLVFAEIIALQVLRYAMLDKASGSTPNIQKLQIVAIITAALSESIAVYGLVMFLIIGSYQEFYVFLIIAVILQIYYFPKYSYWQTWLGEETE